ncbi:four helix bundle protein [Candidatus Dojkabacteria bacterium]|uniref:Four helix bundle protein n=1 Tax=Candidatus Dojkabacteria bacterium TaxID=2099670 RepID=A0A955LAW1_9BACT|nr:four helix bundle protein [Candidatus Dojkabacteria bacterium]
MVIYNNLQIYKRALALSKEVYVVTNEFPSDERFGLISQIRRAAVSVFSNIAEGSARGSNKDFSRFLSMAVGSITEVQAQFEFAVSMSFISQEKVKHILDEIIEVRKMITSYQNKIYETKK